jgi:Homeodomain-like domain
MLAKLMPERSPVPVCCSKLRDQLDRPAHLRSLRHQPQYRHSRAAVVPRIGGLEAVLHDKRQQRYRQALTGGQAAHLIAITCSPVPDGHDHWTVRLLAGKAVELGFVESISPETIRQLLKKMRLLPWQHEQWCIPAVGAEFVAAMEDVLDLYEEAYDPCYPTVCFDEKLVAPEADVRPPEPMEPGQPERVDYEYERLGTANLFFNALALVRLASC